MGKAACLVNPLPGVVLFELQAGATTRADRADVETLRRALGQRIVGTTPDDWVLAGRCLARYAERWEAFGLVTTSPTHWLP